MSYRVAVMLLLVSCASSGPKPEDPSKPHVEFAGLRFQAPPWAVQRRVMGGFAQVSIAEGMRERGSLDIMSQAGARSWTVAETEAMIAGMAWVKLEGPPRATKVDGHAAYTWAAELGPLHGGLTQWWCPKLQRNFFAGSLGEVDHEATMHSVECHHGDATQAQPPTAKVGLLGFGREARPEGDNWRAYDGSAMTIVGSLGAPVASVTTPEIISNMTRSGFTDIQVVERETMPAREVTWSTATFVGGAVDAAYMTFWCTEERSFVVMYSAMRGVRSKEQMRQDLMLVTCPD